MGIEKICLHKNETHHLIVYEFMNQSDPMNKKTYLLLPVSSCGGSSIFSHILCSIFLNDKVSNRMGVCMHVILFAFLFLVLVVD